MKFIDHSTIQAQASHGVFTIRSLLLALGLAFLAPAASAAEPNSKDACAAEGEVKFICGIANPEDLAPVPGSEQLLASSQKLGSVGFYLIDTHSKQFRPVALSLAEHRDPRYADCPAPDLEGLLTHGIDLKPAADGKVTVYAINHGGRESIEVFSLSPQESTAQWVGCVLAAPNVNLNSVAALPDGSLLYTQLSALDDPDWKTTLYQAQVSGAVYHWQPGRGHQELPYTRLSGPNGVAVTADGKTAFVAAYGAYDIWRIPLAGGTPIGIKVDFRPDNLRWAPDGSLLVAGPSFPAKDASAIPGPNFREGRWVTARIHPTTMQLEPLASGPLIDGFPDISTTVEADGMQWIGTSGGDRVGYLPKAGSR